MELTCLGFDHWFEEHAAGIRLSGQSPARVTAVDRDAFLIRTSEREMQAVLSGKFRFTLQSAADLPCVGDWVCVEVASAGGPAIIHRVLPRKTFLRRKCPGKPSDFQMIAANIDTAFIIQGCPSDFNLARLDRYLVMVNEGGVEPQIILSKVDLIDSQEQERLLAAIQEIGIQAPIILLSNATGFGLEGFQNGLVPGKTYSLLGSSGVGKTSLINRLLGRDALATRAVSETGEGVHTTTRRQLILLSNGAMLIDTPGLRELGVGGAGEGMDMTFRDMGEYSVRCRFADCTHTQEPGCAIRAALLEGKLSDAHYQNYLKLKKEADYHNLTYVEKRRKDRAFGKFVKSSLKQMKT